MSAMCSQICTTLHVLTFWNRFYCADTLRNCNAGSPVLAMESRVLAIAFVDEKYVCQKYVLLFRLHIYNPLILERPRLRLCGTLWQSYHWKGDSFTWQKYVTLL